MENTEFKEKIIVAYPWDKSISSVDPARIQFATDARLVDALYGNLIKYNDAGSIVGDLASLFFWEDGYLKISITKDAKNSHGELITLEDVVFSLKRLIVLDINTHGKLKEYICENKITSIDDECSGLFIKQDFVYLKPKKDEYKNLLLHLLTNLDYKIISKASVNLKNLKIVDYSKTTGAYFLKNDYNGTSLTLQKNTFYFNQEKRPKLLVLTHTEIVPEKGALDIRSVDVIHSLIKLNSYNGYDDVEINENFQVIFKTKPFFMENVTFSYRFVSRVLLSHRNFIAHILEEFVKEAEVNKHRERTYQYFPETEEGGLGPDFTDTLRQTRIANTLQYEKEIKLLAPKRYMARWEGLGYSLKYPFIKFVKLGEEYDVMLWEIDTSYQINLSAIEYAFSTNFIDLSKDEKTAWLKQFKSLSNNTTRSDSFKNLHKKILMEGYVYPMFIYPDVTYARKGIDLELSKLQPATELQKIFINE